MSAATILRCLDCGTPIERDDGRYVCPRCGAEVHLDGRGEEVWQTPVLLVDPVDAVAA
jgi:DNA-directed RNA polymerase subunit RPC12/RpoP